MDLFGALLAFGAVVGAAAASWFAAINRLKAGKGGVAAAGARLTLQAKKRPP